MMSDTELVFNIGTDTGTFDQKCAVRRIKHGTFVFRAIRTLF